MGFPRRNKCYIMFYKRNSLFQLSKSKETPLKSSEDRDAREKEIMSLRQVRWLPLFISFNLL